MDAKKSKIFRSEYDNYVVAIKNNYGGVVPHNYPQTFEQYMRIRYPDEKLPIQLTNSETKSNDEQHSFNFEWLYTIFYFICLTVKWIGISIWWLLVHIWAFFNFIWCYMVNHCKKPTSTVVAPNNLMPLPTSLGDQIRAGFTLRPTDESNKDAKSFSAERLKSIGGRKVFPVAPNQWNAPKNIGPDISNRIQNIANAENKSGQNTPATISLSNPPPLPPKLLLNEDNAPKLPPQLPSYTYKLQTGLDVPPPPPNLRREQNSPAIFNTKDNHENKYNFDVDDDNLANIRDDDTADTNDEIDECLAIYYSSELPEPMRNRIYNNPNITDELKNKYFSFDSRLNPAIRERQAYLYKKYGFRHSAAATTIQKPHVRSTRPSNIEHKHPKQLQNIATDSLNKKKQ